MKKVFSNFKSITERIKSSKNSIKHDPFDVRNFNKVREKNPRILKTYEEGIDEYPPFEEMQQDVFSSLYKYNPELLELNQMELVYQLNQQVMKGVLESPKYKELRLLTKMDTVNSTVGTEVLGEQVKDIMLELQKKLSKDLNKAKAAQDEIQQASEDLKTKEGEDSPAGETNIEAEMSLKKAKQRLKEASESIKKHIEKKERKNINRIIDNTIQLTRETSDMISNWGLDQDPNFERLSYNEKIKLVNRLKGSKKLKQLALLAGRYKRLASFSRLNKINKGSNEVYSTTLGDELTKILPSELLSFISPHLKKIFELNYLEKKVLQYQYRGKMKKHKGPIVCCIDGSGSMSGPNEIWAKAVAISLLDIAKSQKRNFLAIHFDSTWDKERLHTNEFKRTDAYNISEVINLAEYFPGGGTLFEPPLDLARSKIEEDKGYTKADIVFITDGCSVCSDSWLKDFNNWKHMNKVNVYSVIIDSQYNTDSSVKEFSSKVIPLKRLESHKDEAALEVFGLL